MDTKELELKVQKAEEKVKKWEATLARHHQQLLTKQKSGDRYGVERKEEDIKSAAEKLEDADRILKNWKERLHTKIKNDRFLEENAPEVIKNFLEEWKRKSFEWHVRKLEAYEALKKQLKEEQRAATIEFMKQKPECQQYFDERGELKESSKWFFSMPNPQLEKYLSDKGLDYEKIRIKLNNFANSTVLMMNKIRNEEERLAFLESELENEKNAKMLDLIQRIHVVVGTILNADNLRVSRKGNLDGYIIGEKGKVEIRTIGAGGFNIQCFHYRVLVQAM